MENDQNDLSGAVVTSLERENLNEEDSIPEVIKVWLLLLSANEISYITDIFGMFSFFYFFFFITNNCLTDRFIEQRWSKIDSPWLHVYDAQKTASTHSLEMRR